MSYNCINKFETLKIEYRLEDVDAIAKQLINSTNSKVLLFNGEMGTGKTTLIKAIVKELGSIDDVNSPTYSLVNEYKIQNDSIFHFDLYRIEEEEELYNFGIEDYLNTSCWILVEWPQLLLPMLGDDYNSITIQSFENRSRTLILETKD